MYKKGDYVVKMPEGICKIENIGHPDTTGMNKTKEYYILVPINEKTSKIYLPVDYVDGRIRNMISKEEAIQLIKSIPNITETEIHNEKMREQEYKAAILSGDNKKIVSIIKLIYTRKQERIKQGKKAQRPMTNILNRQRMYSFPNFLLYWMYQKKIWCNSSKI